MNEGKKLMGGLVGFILFVAFAIWMSFAAPCGCYAGAPVKDVPLRCWEERNK